MSPKGRGERTEGGEGTGREGRAGRKGFGARRRHREEALRSCQWVRNAAALPTGVFPCAVSKSPGQWAKGLRD